VKRVFEGLVQKKTAEDRGLAGEIARAQNRLEIIRGKSMTSKNDLLLAKYEGKAMKKQLFKRCHSSLNTGSKE
jgi:hypothetical protein